MSLKLLSTTAPLPTTHDNFSTKLTYSERYQLLGYFNSKSCYLISLGNNGDGDSIPKTVVQFPGHTTSNVSCISFSPQGNYIASGDESGRVIIWEVLCISGGDTTTTTTNSYDFKIKNEFKVLSNVVKDISWDFEGKRLVIVGDGSNEFGKFITWDSGNSVGEISGHSSMINCCSMNPNGRPMRCFTCDNEGSVVFYKGVPFKFQQSDREHHIRGSFIRGCNINNDGSLMCSCGSDRKICLYDGKNGNFIKYLINSNNVKSGFYGCCWLNNERLIVIGSSIDYYINGELIDSLDGSNTLYVGISKINNENEFIVVTKEGYLQKISINNDDNKLKIDYQINGHCRGITSISSDNNMNKIYTGSFDGTVIQWDISNMNDTINNSKTITKHSNAITSISTTTTTSTNDNDSKSITTCSWDGTLTNTNISNMTINKSIKFDKQPKVSFPFESFESSESSSSLLLVVDFDNNIFIINSSTLEIIKQLDNTNNNNNNIVTCTMNKQYIVIGYDNSNEIQVYPYTYDNNSSALNINNNDIFTLCKLINTPSSITLSSSSSQSNGEMYLSCGDIMGKIVVYDINKKSLVTSRWAFHSGKITSMDWSPMDGGSDNETDLIVTGSLDTHIMIYSLKKPMKVIKLLNAHKDGISNVKWISFDRSSSSSSSSNIIISTGLDGCIKKWQLLL